MAAVTWVGLTTQTPHGAPEFATARQPGYGFSPEIFAPPVSLPVSVTTVPMPSPAPPPIQLSWQEFQAYLMAHQEFSPSISMQGLAPLVRSVSTGAVDR